MAETPLKRKPKPPMPKCPPINIVFHAQTNCADEPCHVCGIWISTPHYVLYFERLEGVLQRGYLVHEACAEPYLTLAALGGDENSSSA